MRTAPGMERGARRTGAQAGPWLERLARLGFAVRGIVYLLIGVLALQAALGFGSPNVNQTTVLQKIYTQPFGKFILWVVVIGLAGYAMWRMIQAVFDTENISQGRNGLLKRIGYFISSLAYFALTWFGYQLANGMGGGGGANATQDFTARLMSAPFGQVLVALVGLIILGVGLYGIYIGLASKIEKRFSWGKMGARTRRLAIFLGRLGYVSRGVVYSIIGVFLLQAALTQNPSRAGGLGEALQALARQPYGPWILGVVAIGLIAFGVYALALARYRRIDV